MNTYQHNPSTKPAKGVPGIRYHTLLIGVTTTSRATININIT